jgi:hypothetical protein
MSKDDQGEAEISIRSELPQRSHEDQLWGLTDAFLNSSFPNASDSGRTNLNRDVCVAIG